MALVKSADGVDIAYDVHGDDTGPFAVVLVHGWAGNRTYWESQIEFLRDRYKVITLDLGGHGESGLGRPVWTLDAFGTDVVAAIEAAGVERVALVGHSMGGDAVVYAARALGERVAGIVWVDAFRSLGNEPVSPPETVDGFLAPFRADFVTAVTKFARSLFPASAHATLVDRVASDMASGRREATMGSLGFALNREPPLFAALAQISVPIVAINPDIALTDVESLKRHGVETIIVEGIGHFVMLEAPVRFNELLASTLASYFR